LRETLLFRSFRNTPQVLLRAADVFSKLLPLAASDEASHLTLDYSQQLLEQLSIMSNLVSVKDFPEFLCREFARFDTEVLEVIFDVRFQRVDRSWLSI
jgi:hypothetical protein